MGFEENLMTRIFFGFCGNILMVHFWIKDVYPLFEGRLFHVEDMELTFWWWRNMRRNNFSTETGADFFYDMTQFRIDDLSSRRLRESKSKLNLKYYGSSKGQKIA